MFVSDCMPIDGQNNLKYVEIRFNKNF